jgi:hypothetical protein
MVMLQYLKRYLFYKEMIMLQYLKRIWFISLGGFFTY